MTTHVQANVEHDVSPSGQDDGYSLHLTRINQYGERASSLSYGGLSEADLYEIIRAAAVALGKIMRGAL